MTLSFYYVESVLRRENSFHPSRPPFALSSSHRLISRHAFPFAPATSSVFSLIMNENADADPFLLPFPPPLSLPRKLDLGLSLSSRLFFSFFLFSSPRCFFHFVDSVAFFLLLGTPPPPRQPFTLAGPVTRRANCIVSCLVLQRFSTIAHAVDGLVPPRLPRNCRSDLVVFTYCSHASVETIIISRNLYFSEYFDI